LPDETARRIGFAGTPAFADRVLHGLLGQGIRPVAVLTAPDARSGRGRKFGTTPVRTSARAERIPVLQPRNLGDAQTYKEISAFELDVLVVVAYGLIVPPRILELPKYGCINLHPSLLPRWRGAAPIERAIMSGDTETGVCVMQMDSGVDTGPLLAIKRLHLDDTMTGDCLRTALASLGINALCHAIKHIDTLEAAPQESDGALYAEKLTDKDQVINWSRSSRIVARQIHALNSAAPAISCMPTGDDALRVRFLKAEYTLGEAVAPPGTVLEAPAGQIEIACGVGKISVLEACVLRGSGRRLSARDLLNGFAGIFRTGNRFGG